jgi:predicted amidohydrolase YtcJ
MRFPDSLLLACLVFPMTLSGQARPQHRATPATTTKSNMVPEIIFFNGVIYTGSGFETDKPETVQAMAIGGGKVLAVGSTDKVTRLAGPKTILHDLSSSTTGNFIFPGFNDAHTHLGPAGQTKLNVDLTGAQSLADMLTKIQSYAEKAAPGHWLTGGNWDHTLWAEKVLPTRQDLDTVTGDHPAFLDRIDGHIAVANSAALKAAGVTGATKSPHGGAIDLDKNGQPTGILRESAKDLVTKIIPPPTAEERRRGLELAIEDAIAHGVTSVQDFSDWDDFLVFEQREKEGKLDVRVSEWIPFIDPLDELLKMRAHHDQHDPMLHTAMLKGFMDGSLGSRTAAMKAPYTDDAGNTGLPQFTQDELNRKAIASAKAGFQMGFHAIGDKATEMALDAFAEAEKNLPTIVSSRSSSGVHSRPCSDVPGAAPCLMAVPIPSPRYRIEHAQVVDPADIPRFKRLGVIASMQPNHLLTDMNWAEARLAFGTDYPVEPITPFRGLYAAVTRMNEAGTKSYFPQNKLTRGEALYAYTQGSAYAEFAEHHKGKLQPGYDADFIVVDRDLYKVAAPAILSTHVVGTYVGGRQVFPYAAAHN